MRQDQLQKARQSRWRQDGNALLTLDDAERWLAETPLCLYLPRYQHLPVPAPSFVEAIAGRSDPTPAPDQIAAASQMLARLVASGAVIALNLFGSASGIVGEQPDFLATPEALPYLYALQPQRNPKRPPTSSGASRVSPLAVEAFHILTREGALTTTELRERLGREVTEAATLRALGELWHAMRVVPVPGEHGAPAHWELLSARHGREINIGSTQSQTTAFSILVSFYLQSAVAAAPRETEIFLSPLAPRSRIRDVIHGLSATRQLASFSLNGEEQLYVEGTLPEVEEAEPAAAFEANAPRLDAGLEQNQPSFPEAAAPSSAFQASRKRQTSRPSFADRARGGVTPRERRPGERPPRRAGGFARPERSGSRGPRPAGSRPAASESSAPPSRERRERPPFERGFDRGARPTRPSASGKFERRSRPPREGSSQGNFERRGKFDRPKRSQGRGSQGRGFEGRKGGFGDREKFQKRGAPPPSPRPFRERSSQSGGERPPFRPGGERRPFSRDKERPFREDRPGPSRPFVKREGDRPAAGPRRFEGRPPRRESGRPYKRPYAPSGQRPPRRGPAPGGSERPARSFKPKADGEPRPFRREGERPSRPGGFQKPGGRERSFGKPGDRPRTGGFRPRTQGADAGAPSIFRKPAAGGKSLGKARERSFGKPGDRPRTGGFRPRTQGADAGAPSNFRKPAAGGKSFGKPRPLGSGKPGGRPPGKGPFRPGKPGGKRFDNRRAGEQGRGPKRPGGFTPPRRKPRGESREGDEG